MKCAARKEKSQNKNEAIHFALKKLEKRRNRKRNQKDKKKNKIQMQYVRIIMLLYLYKNILWIILERDCSARGEKKIYCSRESFTRDFC